MQKYCVLRKEVDQDGEQLWFTNGLRKLRLSLIKDGREVDHLIIASGQPLHQELRRAVDSMQGSQEPLPEGHFVLGDPDSYDEPNEQGVNFAGAIGDFETLWPSINSPIWTGIHPAKGQAMHPFAPRAFTGVHYDNPNGWPGTIGCVGLQSIAACVTWWQWNQGQRVLDLFVDYGLGSVTLPAAPEGAKLGRSVYLGEARVGDLQIIGGQSWAPVADLARALGLVATWDPKAKSVTLAKP